MKTATMVWIFGIILVALGAGWYFLASSSSTPTLSTNTPPAQISTTTTTSAGAPMTAMVMYDGKNFSPATVTIAKGGTVTFMDTAGTMWVASDPHPVHDGYDGTTRAQHCAAGYAGPAPFDACATGSQFVFTFNQVGSWGYHDHLNESAGGTVVVQ